MRFMTLITENTKLQAYKAPASDVCNILADVIICDSLTDGSGGTEDWIYDGEDF